MRTKCSGGTMSQRHPKPHAICTELRILFGPAQDLTVRALILVCLGWSRRLLVGSGTCQMRPMQSVPNLINKLLYA